MSLASYAHSAPRMRGIAAAAHLATTASSSPTSGSVTYRPRAGDRRSQLDEDRPQVDLNREGMSRPSRRS